MPIKSCSFSCLLLIHSSTKSPSLPIMGSSLYHLIMLHLLSILLHLSTLFTYSFSHPPLQPILCNSSDSSALLKFKESFVIDKLASSHPLAYPKLNSWMLQGDCCSWDGVLCDKNDGHVIGLDLTSSCLFGSINSTSSLFRLKRLQWLSLADNHFNYSRIPPELAHLSNSLTYLNLSMSSFSGQIPSEISMLSKLVVLDLASNVDSSERSLLQLNKPTYKSLVQNVTNLEQLLLSWVDISSEVPNTLANLSSLSLLFLRGCNLQDEFPSRLFLSPNIQFLSVRHNPQLSGHLPQFSNHSQIKFLRLADTSFSGELPESIQNLRSLTVLDMSNTNFSGPISPSFGNLTKLTDLDLSYISNLRVGDLSWLGHLTNLQHLCFQGTNINGEIPSSLANLKKLSYLSLGSCQMTGHIPIWIQNFRQLKTLDLSHNSLQGPIQEPVFSSLVHLEYLSLSGNNLS